VTAAGNPGLKNEGGSGPGRRSLYAPEQPGAGNGSRPPGPASV